MISTKEIITDQVVRTGSPSKRGCCRSLVVWSQAPHQYLVSHKEAYAIHTDQKGTQTESTDRAVRTSSPGAVDCAVRRQISPQRERERERERESEKGCTASQYIESRNGEDP